MWPWSLAAAAGVLATSWGEYSSGTALWVVVLDLVLGAAGCVLVLALPRRPVMVGLVLGVLAGLAPTGTPPASVGMLGVARHRRFAVAAGVAAVSAVAHILRGWWRPIPGLGLVWWTVLVIVGHAALLGWGALLAAQQALITSLAERARRAEAEQGRRVAEARAAERTRIAREMHDVLAHRLSLLATYAGALEYRPDMPADKLATAAGVIRSTVHQALDELRDVISLLREDDTGPARPVPALADVPALIAESRTAGTPVEVHDELTEPDTLPPVAGRTAYRVLQEALTNARKHAPGKPVTVALGGTRGERLHIAVSNPLAANGGPATIPGTGTGLVGLTERVRLAGGRLDHQAGAGAFEVRAWLPWPA
ncbi:sensor histidine kinase [Amycolatopsis sp. K13G38]|uniref:histidine kinase n=2 Tax=Amycolatopsis acididurans TaxID=2724524 RepID=A0ABX1JC97_9PSEU|nr:sensor histidine kinase [Amycolatopsis acididurans]